MSIILRVGAVKSSRVHETHYGSGDEASAYTDADVLDIPLPEHTYQRPHPPPSTHAHCSTGYFGLPYQDHNYGMPPPLSPSRPTSPRPPSPLQVNGVVQMEEEVKTTPFVSVVEEVVEDSITRCICGYLHDDGYMICCDRCSVWQHIDCMGVDRNNIPESYFCELCQPRILDALKAKMLQKRKREELAARNVLSDSSATDTDPEEAANALASMGKKLPTCKKKSLKQKRSPKVKDKQTPLKLKVGKGIGHKKAKKSAKKEKENVKAAKPRRMFKTGSQKLKPGKSKNRPPLTLEQLSIDPWNSNLSPWVDSYEFAHENHYSPAVREFSSNSHLIGQSMDISSMISDQLLTQVTCVADVKKNRKGLKATEEIPAGQAIIEYKGKVVLRHDYDREYAFVNSFKKLQPFVLFYSKLDVDLCVDARVYGNEARFVRRSCSPNSEVQHILSQGKVYFVIVSKKDIHPGSEITIPFDYNYENCSYCVECACIKSNCMVARYWKRLKNAKKSSPVENNLKRKRQPSGRDGIKVSPEDRPTPSSSQGSPTKTCTSPVKALQMKLVPASSPHPPLSSPVKLSNVCTLLAASALLDGQPELVSGLQLETHESLPQAPPAPTPPLPPPKSATSSRRGSRMAEECIKEEKPAPAPVVQPKEKHKTKEPKPKEKESKDTHHTEVKKERRPSSRRQSQEEQEEPAEIKPEVAAPPAPSAGEPEEAHIITDCPRKLTREERKLDAIMKAFEKMEKREERRKEAMARGDTAPKKCSGDAKVKKKDEPDSSNNSTSGGNVSSCPTPQDVPSGEGEVIKTEPPAEEHQEIKSSTINTDVKPESTSIVSPSDVSSKQCVASAIPTVVPSVAQETPKEESPQKTVRQSGKRKRRRSRVQSTTVLSDAASVSTDEGNSNSSFPIGPVSLPSTPALAPVNTPVQHVDMDGALFKYIKTKKHLFEEWSSKQEDEASKNEEEIFVQCLPNPHVNTMDHLQRRHSHSAGYHNRGAESSVGSAKKRWLRQAMHEVPTPVAFNHSLSVSTDSTGGSPVHGGTSPNPGTCLGSPGSGSPLDFVTPLKKRRLMRESMTGDTNGPTAASTSSGAESFFSNGVGITPKTNGVKQFYPAHRHSTDDRLLLHKGYPHQNGYREVTSVTSDRRSEIAAAASHTFLNSSSAHFEGNDLELHCTVPDQRLQLSPDPVIDPLPVHLADPQPIPVSFPRVNGISESMPVNSVPLIQSSSPYVLKFRGIFERMEVNSSDETFKGKENQPATSSSRMEKNDGCSSRVSLHGFEDDSRIDSSASVTTVVVVNSSVYTGVNSLIDEGSEAGCVTAKSIMDVDSPATVCVDLNAHDMEPSLRDTGAVVSLDHRLFTRNSRGMRAFEAPSECLVNSSEDIESLPVVTGGHSRDICDNVCTESASTQSTVGIGNHNGERTPLHIDLEEGQEVVDSSQNVSRSGIGDSAAVFLQELDNSVLATQDQSGTSSGIKLYGECISSSAQASSSVTQSTPERPGGICDSVGKASESGLEMYDINRQCDTGVDVRTQGPDFYENSVDAGEVRTCDSVGGSVALRPCSHRTLSEVGYEEDIGDSAVSESHCSEQQFLVSGTDGNVDSTCSETNRGTPQLSLYNSSANREAPEGDVVTADGCCDSNFERLPNADAMYDSSVTGDESSLEGLCVSSSSVADMQSCGSWDCYRKEAFRGEAVPDYSVSTAALDCNSEPCNNTSNGTEASIMPTLEEVDNNIAEVRTLPTTSEVCTSLAVGSTAKSSDVSCSSHSLPTHPLVVSPTSSSSSSSSSSSAISAEGTLSSTFPSPSSGQHHAATTALQTSASPPGLSTAEATPCVRKKVSLLEYRKRLKDKPAIPGASDTKASSSSAVVWTSSPSSHHKLSATLSLFLASSPTSSASSTSPSKSPSSSSSRQDKHRMPTLATLPLFKSADAKREKDKKKSRPKVERQLSLTDRLRLEFGLEDCGEDAGNKKKDDGKKPRVLASPPSPPPPPPPHPPPPLPPGAASPYHHHQPVTRHNVKDGDESEAVSITEGSDDSAPPPPPAAGSTYPSPATGFATHSVHSQPGFHGSQVPLANGGPGSYHSYQQQSGISSTTLPLIHGIGGRERQVRRFSGHNGPAGPSVAAYPQQPSSASHMAPATSHSQAWLGDSHPQARGANQGPPPAPSTNVHLPHTPSPQQYDYNHWPQSQTIGDSSIISDDHPPPPPPPSRHHRHSLVSSSSSLLHRHHHHHSSSEKSSKAASSSSSHY